MDSKQSLAQLLFVDRDRKKPTFRRGSVESARESIFPKWENRRTEIRPTNATRKQRVTHKRRFDALDKTEYSQDSDRERAGPPPFRRGFQIHRLDPPSGPL